MGKQNLEELSIEQLQKKQKGLKMMIGLFIPIIILLFFFVMRDYMKGNEMDHAILIIAICSLGGPATVYPEFKAVQKELRSRNQSS